jgi:hypothetical protein
VRDALGYAEEYKERRRRRQAARLALALAAALVVSVASWAIWSLQQKPRNVEIARQGPAVSPGSGKEQGKAPEIAHHEAVTIDLPPRRRGNDIAAAKIILSRGRLLLEIRLPNGSPEGKYKFRIVNDSGKVLKTVEATGRTEDRVTRLKFALETSDLSPGDYIFSVLEPDLDEWLDYPLTVK